MKQEQLFDPAEYEPPTQRFGPKELLADIEDKWGKHGAHADLFKWMWRKLDAFMDEEYRNGR